MKNLVKDNYFMIIIFILGTFLFLIGLSYIYWPKLIIKFNSFFKRFLFDETQILAYRKKMGIMYFLISIILLYIGLQMSGTILPDNRKSLSQAYSYYYLKKYDKAQSICESILLKEPQNTRVLEQLALILYSKNNTKEAIKYCRKTLSINPESYNAKKILKLLENKQ